MNVETDEVTPMLASLKAQLGNPQPVLLGIGDVVRQITLENFGAQGIDRPNIWPPLSEKYAKKVGRGYATLEVTGELKDSVQQPVIEGDSVGVKATDHKASYHQRGEGRNPMRSFFPVDENTGELTPNLQDRITEILDNHFSQV